MMRRSPHFNALVMSACALCPVGAGCGPKIRAVELDDQIVSNKQRTATVNTPKLEVSATSAAVPWAADDTPIAFLLQITNLGDEAVRFDLDGVKLQDGLGRVRGVIPPEKLWRAFSIPSAEPAAQAVLVRHRQIVHVRSKCYSYHYSPPLCGAYRVAGFGVWGPYYDVDPYYEQRRTARFLAQLLESQTIAPQNVAVGYVVFPYTPQKDDELTLQVELGPAQNVTSTQPTAAAPTTVALVFRVR